MAKKKAKKTVKREKCVEPKVEKASKVNKFGRRIDCQSGFIDANLDKPAAEIVRLWNQKHPEKLIKTGINRIRGHLRYMVQHKQITKEQAAKILKKKS